MAELRGKAHEGHAYDLRQFRTVLWSVLKAAERSSEKSNMV